MINPFGILFHKKSVYFWMILLGMSIGYMLGRTQDPLDRAVRKAQNEARPVLQTSLRGSVVDMDAQLRADPAKREAYARTVSNNMAAKAKAIKTLEGADAYITLALKQNFIDNSLQKYLGALGDIQMRHGFMYLAVTNLEKAVGINPYDASSIYNLAMSYLGLYQITGAGSEKDTLAEKALAALNLGLAVTPDNPDLMYGLALLYTDRGAYGRALPLYGRLLELNPADEAALMGAGRIYFEQKEYDKSRQVYEKAEALLVNQANSGGRYLQANPERKKAIVKQNLQILYGILGSK